MMRLDFYIVTSKIHEKTRGRVVERLSRVNKKKMRQDVLRGK